MNIAHTWRWAVSLNKTRYLVDYTKPFFTKNELFKIDIIDHGPFAATLYYVSTIIQAADGTQSKTMNKYA